MTIRSKQSVPSNMTDEGFAVRALLTLFKAVVVLAMVQPIGFAASNTNAWVPRTSLISEIEADLVMPSGASPLNTYARYYFGEIAKKHRVLIGTFVRDAGRAGVHVVDSDKVPHVLDAGCAVVNLKYDVKRRKIISFFCNGVA